MDDDESFLPNLASMLEVSLVEVAEQAVSEEQAEKSDTIPQNEAIVENGFFPEFQFPTEEKEMSMQGEVKSIQSETELDEQLRTSPCRLFQDLEDMPIGQGLVQDSEFAHDMLLDPKYQATEPVSEEEEKTVYTKAFKDLDCVSYMRLHCTVCDCHIGCGGDANFNMSFHKILQVLVCHECEHFYGTGEFDIGEDGSEMYCRWCGQGGQVFCCSHCPSVFCKKCIRRNLGKKKVKEISESSEWTCYKCDARPLWQLRALCRALHNFMKEQSNEEKKMSEEDAEKRAGFNKQHCCKGDRLPYHRTGQPLRRLQLPPTQDDIKKKNDTGKNTNNDSILQKALSSVEKTSLEDKPQFNMSKNIVTYGSKIVPIDTRKLLEPSNTMQLKDTASGDSTNAPINVYHKITPNTYGKVVLTQAQKPVIQQSVNILAEPPPLSPTIAGTPMVRFPESPVSNIHPTVNKIVLNPGNLIYTMPHTTMPVHLSPPGPPPPLVMPTSASSQARRYYLLSSGGSNDPPKLVPITARQNPNLLNSLSHIQVISPPRSNVKVISPTTANKNIQTHENNQNVAEIDDDDDDVVEVFSNVESSEKLTCDWLFKAFRETDETSRLLSSYVELLRRKFFSEVNGKGTTAKGVRRFAGKFRYILLKAAKKLNSDRELIAKEFSDWLIAEREKHGINLKNDSDTCKEDEAANTAEPEQKEPDLLLDMDCESDPEESSPHEDDVDTSNSHIKEDLMECSENLSENEADNDPFTVTEILERKRRLEAFKPFYTRTIRELLRDKYSCKLLFQIISEQNTLSDNSCQKCSGTKKENSDVSLQTDDPLKLNNVRRGEWSGAFSDFLATTSPEIELESSTRSADAAAGSPNTWSDCDTEEKIGSHKIKNSVTGTTSVLITNGHVKRKIQNKSTASTVNGCNMKHSDSSLNGILTEKTQNESKQRFSATPSRRNKRRRKSESSNDDSHPRLSPQLFLKKKRTESPGVLNDSSNQTSSDAGSLVSCSVRVVSKVKLDFTDINSKPSTSWATPPKIKNKGNQTNSRSNAASPKLDCSLKLPFIKLERIDVDLVKSAMEKNIIKPCTVKLNKVE